MIEFTILRDGSVSGLVTRGSSGDLALDRPAFGAITASNPFHPLPSQFGGKYLRLRFYFVYNCKEDCPPPCKEDCPPPGISSNDGLTVGASPFFATAVDLKVSPVLAEVVGGADRQFSVSGNTKTLIVIVNWSVAGPGCVGQACGTISPTGLYTAPHGAPHPPTVTVTATLAANPSKKASATVTIVSPNPSH